MVRTLSERALNINWGWLGRCRWQSCWRLSRRRDWITADTDLASETVLAFLKMRRLSNRFNFN